MWLPHGSCILSMLSGGWLKSIWRLFVIQEPGVKLSNPTSCYQGLQSFVHKCISVGESLPNLPQLRPGIAAHSHSDAVQSARVEPRCLDRSPYGSRYSHDRLVFFSVLVLPSSGFLLGSHPQLSQSHTLPSPWTPLTPGRLQSNERSTRRKPHLNQSDQFPLLVRMETSRALPIRLGRQAFGSGSHGLDLARWSLYSLPQE